MKKIFMMFIFALFLIPSIVFAAEDAVLYEKLYKILGEDGKLKITDIKTLPLAALEGNPENTEAGSYDVSYSRAIAAYIHGLDEVKELLNEYKKENPNIDVFCLSYTNCGIGIFYDSDQRGTIEPDEYPNGKLKHYDVEIEVVEEYDEKAYAFFKDKNKIENDVPYQDYYLYDLAYINQLYNQNNGQVSLLEYTYHNSELILNAFPEIKTILENNPEYSFKYAMYSNMGSGWSNVEYIHSADFVAFNSNVAYLQSTLRLHIAPIIYVSDKTSDEDLIAAAEKRIKEYINNDDVVVKIDDITPTFSDENELKEIFADLNEFLSSTTKEVVDADTSRVYSLKIGSTSSKKNFFIVKTSEDNIKDLEIKAYEKSTGIITSSTSALMPLDAFLEASDVTSELSSISKVIKKAYDINLYSNINSSYVKNIPDGIKIYIPIENGFDTTNKKVAYINDSGEISETYEFTIEKIDDQEYVTFVTDHLSIYGIVEEQTKEPSNPPTGTSGTVITLTVLALLGILLVNIKQNIVKNY